MSRNNIETLSYKELVALQGDINAAIAFRKAERAKEIKARLAELARKNGFSVDELFGKGRTSAKATVKFRNPKNANETWAGRGRQPLWLAAALKKGAKLESFAV